MGTKGSCCHLSLSVCHLSVHNSCTLNNSVPIPRSHLLVYIYNVYLGYSSIACHGLAFWRVSSFHVHTLYIGDVRENLEKYTIRDRPNFNIATITTFKCNLGFSSSAMAKKGALMLPPQQDTLLIHTSVGLKIYHKLTPFYLSDIFTLSNSQLKIYYKLTPFYLSDIFTLSNSQLKIYHKLTPFYLSDIFTLTLHVLVMPYGIIRGWSNIMACTGQLTYQNATFSASDFRLVIDLVRCQLPLKTSIPKFVLNLIKQCLKWSFFKTSKFYVTQRYLILQQSELALIRKKS